MLQNKETTVQRYQKILNQNTRKNPGIEVALFNFTGDMGIDNFGCLTSSFAFFFYFVMNLQKEKIMWRALTADPPPLPIRASALLTWPSVPLRAYVLYG